MRQGFTDASSQTLQSSVAAREVDLLCCWLAALLPGCFKAWLWFCLAALLLGCLAATYLPV